MYLVLLLSSPGATQEGVALFSATPALLASSERLAEDDGVGDGNDGCVYSAEMGAEAEKIGVRKERREAVPVGVTFSPSAVVTEASTLSVAVAAAAGDVEPVSSNSARRFGPTSTMAKLASSSSANMQELNPLASCGCS